MNVSLWFSLKNILDEKPIKLIRESDTCRIY
jgi:hypothetical protein